MRAPVPVATTRGVTSAIALIGVRARLRGRAVAVLGALSLQDVVARVAKVANCSGENLPSRQDVFWLPFAYFF